MVDCIFCKIVKGEIPSHKVYEDDATLAFLDINPISDGHTLVIPKQHFENLLDTSEEDVKAVAVSVKKIVKAAKEALNCDGINILQANFAASGQSVFHYHVHIVPRKEGDGLHLWPPTRHIGHNGKEIAGKIAHHIKS